MKEAKKVFIVIGVCLACIAIGVGLFFGFLWLESEILYCFNDRPLLGVPGLIDFILGLGMGVAFLSLFFSAAFLTSFINDKNDGLNHKVYKTMNFGAKEITKDNSNGFTYLRADDRFLIYSTNFSKHTIWIVRLLAWFLIFGTCISFEMDTPTGFFVFLTFCVTVIWLEQEFRKQKVIVFDRMNGEVTLPGPILLPKRTTPFRNIVPGVSWEMLVFKYARYLNIGMVVWHEYSVSAWSFFVQYMDKNQPLPRGTAFDPYREQDFKRRQSEGFPAPMYPNVWWLTDERCGYIYGTDELKKKIKEFQVNHLWAYDAILNYIKFQKEIPFDNCNDIVWVGVFDKSYVFKLHAPLHEEKVVFHNQNELSDCFLVYAFLKDNRKHVNLLNVLGSKLVSYIPPVGKKTTE